MDIGRKYFEKIHDVFLFVGIRTEAYTNEGTVIVVLGGLTVFLEVQILRLADPIVLLHTAFELF